MAANSAIVEPELKPARKMTLNRRRAKMKNSTAIYRVLIALTLAFQLSAAELADSWRREIETLVQGEKYDEALRSVDALLKQYPDDSTLQRYRVSLAKLVKPASSAASEALSGRDRLELDTLLVIASDAESISEAATREKQLAEFLERSSDFVKRHPGQFQVWLLRAAAALELDRSQAGWESGQRLIALGALESEDGKVRQIMARLNLKKWLVDKLPQSLGATDGQPFTIPDLGLKLLWVQPGTFTMGSPAGETGRFEWEGPQTRVTISRGFWLGGTEVTQGEWQAILGNKPSNFSGSDFLPVEQVSWEDCQQFIAKLNSREQAASRLPPGYAYSLPTQAQWEYACRAGTTGAYAGVLDSMGWYDANSGNRTQPVGQKQANAWGFHDMHGNVWEWCQDWFADNLPGGSITDPVEPRSGSGRVRRGGGLWHVARLCRSAYREWSSPGIRDNDLGFRLALSPVR